MLETEVARFHFDPKAKKIWRHHGDTPPSHIKLTDVRGVQVRVGFKEAGLEELVLEGWNVMDLHPEYRDHRMHWNVVITTAHGPVPLAILSQYRKRDWLDFATPFQLWLLSVMGLYREGADVASDIEDATRQALRRAGLNVLGGYTDMKPSGALDGAPIPVDADLPAPSNPSAPIPARAPLAIDLPEDAPSLWPDVGPNPPSR